MGLGLLDKGAFRLLRSIPYRSGAGRMAKHRELVMSAEAAKTPIFRDAQANSNRPPGERTDRSDDQFGVRMTPNSIRGSAAGVFF
jgi:hypothetical protein